MAVAKDELQRDLREALKDKDTPEVIDDCLKKAFYAESIEIFKQCENAKKWLDWAGSKPQLKIVTNAVPTGILPKGICGKLHDVKVFAKGRPDDEIFNKNEDIRHKVARGNCFLDIDSKEYRGPVCITYATKKFTGGLGDDDDCDKGDNQTWKRYFLKPLDETKRIVATHKENGEAAHFSVKKVEGEMIYCGGSKNVHMVFRNKEDIKKYEGTRYRIAAEICETIIDFLDSMPKEKKDKLLEFLWRTDFTTIFEILSPSHQHVEDLSHLASAQLKFICWTSFHLEEEEICSMSPHLSAVIAEYLGLSPVKFSILLPEELHDKMIQIRQGYGYEGEVLFFLDSDSKVIGLLKKKTIWYIICRAIREKLRAACRAIQKDEGTFSEDNAIKKTEKRIDEIRLWLGLDDASVVKWKEIGRGCIKWGTQKVKSRELTLDHVNDCYPKLWKDFLEDSGLSDRFDMTFTEEDSDEE